MIKFIHIVFFFIFLPGALFSQATVFKEGDKSGIKDNGHTVIRPVYDSIINFDSTGKTCLACYKIMTASANKFIKAFTKKYVCNYLNRNADRLSVKVEGNDTCSVFTLAKHTVKQFTENRNYFIVAVNNKKYLVDRDFKQHTFKGYYDIDFCAEPAYLVTRISYDDGVTVNTGLINFKEEQIIPYAYSDIKVNPLDSLIIGCSAGIRVNTEDDVFDYDGKKIGLYRKHVDMATKNFVIYKLFSPKEYFIVYNVLTKEEKNLSADEVQLYKGDELRIRIKNNWFIYNMLNGEKKPAKQS